MKNLDELLENEKKEVTSFKSESTKVNREFKDSIFRKYFSDGKRLRSLCSALMEISEENVKTIELKTLENVICGHSKNDLAALVNCAVIILAEHQTTISGYMPLRMSEYITEILSKLLNSNEIYRRKVKEKLPIPRFYVLYNGKEPYPKEKILKLSDLFVDGHSDDCSIELTVKVININYDKGHKLLDKCRYVHDYALFIQTVRHYQMAGYAIDDAVYKSVTECISNEIMADFLMEYESEVKNMLTREISFEEIMEIQIEEAREYAIEEGLKEGLKEGIERGLEKGRAEAKIENARKLKMNGVDIKTIAISLGLTQQEVMAI